MLAELRQLGACLAIFVLSTPLFAAASPGVERIEALSASSISDNLNRAIEEAGYRVALDEGWTADFWFTRSLKTSGTQTADALYPFLANGQFVAVVNFTKGFSDYRGQAVPLGLYTLRYQYLPQDANHMGVSTDPDFLLAIPIADDPNPADLLPFKRLVTLSAKSTSTAHPAVIAMATAAVPASVAKDDQGMIVLTIKVQTSTSGKAEHLGIILKGQATQ